MAEEGDGGPPGPIQLPLPVALRELLLDDVEVRLADGTRLGWRHFESGAEAEGQRPDPVADAPGRLRLTPSISPATGSP